MRHFRLKSAVGAALMLLFAVGNGMAQSLPTPGPNQTLGFGNAKSTNGKIVLFTYTENFDCVDQPTEDRTSMAFWPKLIPASSTSRFASRVMRGRPSIPPARP
jgi:hypothetical protein